MLLLLYFIVIACLIIIAVYDIKHLLIPPKPLLIAILSALLINIILDSKIFGVINLTWQSVVVTGFLSAILLSGFFALIFIASKGKWIGCGDVKLAILLGFLIGTTQNIFFTAFILFLGSLIGSIIGISLIISKKKSVKTPIPFAPFLILATLIALFWKNDIIYLLGDYFILP
jgi:prepilin signal peptidase PulO-like enzyme (type II secretory pathway)